MTLTLIENKIPRFFKSATNVFYYKMKGKEATCRKTFWLAIKNLRGPWLHNLANSFFVSSCKLWDLFVATLESPSTSSLEFYKGSNTHLRRFLSKLKGSQTREFLAILILKTRRDNCLDFRSRLSQKIAILERFGLLLRKFWHVKCKILVMSLCLKQLSRKNK